MANENSIQPFDAIVIGSGAGGAAAAIGLARAGVRVLVLEKGAPLPRDGSTLDIGKVVHRGEFLSHEPWTGRDGRTLRPEEHFNVGGKTKWYGAALLRFAAREFQSDDEFSAHGWPLPYQDFLPYYAEAERLLGVRTFDCEPQLRLILDRVARSDSAWQSSPIPLGLSEKILNDRHEATHFDGFASVADLKGDAQTSYLDLLQGSSALQVRTDSEVIELLPGPDPTNVAGVRLQSGEQIQAKCVLLGAGALHSPRLLQRYLSSNQLQLPIADRVGRNLKLHILTALVAVSASRKLDVLRKTMLTVNEKYPHSSLQPLGFDGELIGTLVPKFIPGFLSRQIGARAYGFFLQTEDGSSPENRVYERVDQATGATTRVFDYDAQRTPRSLHEHRHFVRAFQRVLLRAGMLSFTQRTGITGTAHACGTLMAGRAADGCVVDEFGAVWGIGGLFVVDGSILPRSSRVNPSLSIYAWGLRVADNLSRRLSAS